jgi:hypothetical protein
VTEFRRNHTRESARELEFCAERDHQRVELHSTHAITRQILSLRVVTTPKAPVRRLGGDRRQVRDSYPWVSEL